MPNVNDAFLPTPLAVKMSAGVKVAIPDLILDEDNISIDSMTDFTFADIGGQEVLSVSRNDLIDSPFAKNNIIKDSGNLFRKEKYIESTDTISGTFSSNSIDLNTFKPQSGLKFVPPLSSPPKATDVIQYKENITVTYDGSIIIELNNIDPKHKVEVDFFSTPEILDQTVF